MSCTNLRALKTKAEASTNPQLGAVLVVGLNAKSVASFLRLVDATIDASDRAALSHLRRVARLEHLPDNVSSMILAREEPLDEESCTRENCSTEASQPLDALSAMLYILVCRSSIPHEQNLNAALSQLQAPHSARIHSAYITLRVPLVPPTSQEQAVAWSHEYWPTVYKKHNPYGPQHNIVSEAEAEIGPTVGVHMDLALNVGKAGCAMGQGLSVGAVIVERSAHEYGQAIAVAADARWYGQLDLGRCGQGNPLAHAAMRAIAMVARKRKAAEDGVSVDWNDDNGGVNFVEHPLTDIEAANNSRAQVQSGGYLCVNCEIYITHEPCVMCCMALLHSRFSRVIFGRRMLSTGGLVTEDDRIPGYGLFWLPSLNWKLLAWQWSVKDVADELDEDAGWHV